MVTDASRPPEDSDSKVGSYPGHGGGGRRSVTHFVMLHLKAMGARHMNAPRDRMEQLM
jgi:hypothetical protein